MFESCRAHEWRKGRRSARAGTSAHVPRLLLTVAASAFVLSGCGGGPHEAAAPGFEPGSFTAVSGSDYWVLGSVPCKTGRCSTILRTTDGGTSFTTISAPRLEHLGAAGVEPTLLFANRTDGFALVTGLGGALFATHDAGATWSRLALGDVLAFATAGGRAYAVTARCTLQSCARYRFERSPVSGDAWEAAAVPFRPDGPVLDLAARGSNVWLLGTPAGKARSQRDELALSTDRGLTFVTRAGPCYPGLGGQLAPAAADAIWAVCPTGMSAGAWRSTDGGLMFAPVRTPPLVNSAVIAPASRDVAVLARNGAESPLLQTTDGGRHWTESRTPVTQSYALWIGFVDAGFGVALVQTAETRALWRTTDGGASWSEVDFDG